MITDEIVKIFKEIREDSAEPYTEDDFLQYLIKQDGKTIDNSFKGKRYKMRFLNKIQMEFGICFPDDVYNNMWSLSNFSHYVDDRRKRKKLNLQMAQKRLDRSKKTDVNLLVLINLALLPLFFLSPYVLLLPLIANMFLLRFKYLDVRYYQKLVQKINLLKNTSE